MFDGYRERSTLMPAVRCRSMREGGKKVGQFRTRIIQQQPRRSAAASLLEEHPEQSPNQVSMVIKEGISGGRF